MEKKNKVRTCGNCAYLEIRDKNGIIIITELMYV
nr:MAG TPA: hypothetical protein [Crassvirales sp.]